MRTNRIENKNDANHDEFFSDDQAVLSPGGDLQYQILEGVSF